jgi:O-antigen/teichoic acid export membrane protein
MTSLKKVFKDVSVYASGDVVIKGISIISAPIMTRIFSPDEYGIMSFISTGVSLIGGVLILGGDSAYSRYFFESNNNKERQILTSTWFFFLFLWSVILVMLLIPFATQFSEWSFGSRQYTLPWIIALLSAPLTMISSMLAQALRNQFRAKMYTLFNLITICLTVGLKIVFSYIWGIFGFFFAGAIAALLIIPFRIWVVKDLIVFSFSRQLIKKLLSFGLPLVPASLAYWVFNSSDRLMLGKLGTIEDVGLYALGASLVGGLALINNAIGQAWSPHAYLAYENDRDDAPLFFARMLLMIVGVFGAVVVMTSAFAYEALLLLVPEAFYNSYKVIVPLSLGILFFATTQVTAAGISLTKKTYFLLIFSWVVASLNVVLNFILIPRFGMVGASIATLLSYFVLTVSYGIISWKLWPIIYYWHKILPITLVTVLVAIFNYQITYSDYAFLSFWSLVGVKALVAYAVIVLFAFIIDRKLIINAINIIRINK